MYTLVSASGAPMLSDTPGGRSRPETTRRSLQPFGTPSLPKKVPQLSTIVFSHSIW
ncbi:hypothetical protein D9M68_871760 [compost metagenome]